MSETPPLQPDAIRLRPGEQQQLKDSTRVKYVCACKTGKRHTKVLPYDALPPNYCPMNSIMHRDSSWVDEGQE